MAEATYYRSKSGTGQVNRTNIDQSISTQAEETPNCDTVAGRRPIDISGLLLQRIKGNKK